MQRFENKSKDERMEKATKAVLRGDLKKIKIYVDAGFDIYETDSYGRCILFYACMRGFYDVVEYLIMEKNMDVNVLDLKKKSGIHWICVSSSPNVEIVQLLSLKGANLDLQDEEGNTGLMIAAGNGASETLIRTLCMLGATKDLKNNEQKSAIDLALENIGPTWANTVKRALKLKPKNACGNVEAKSMSGQISESPSPTSIINNELDWKFGPEIPIERSGFQKYNYLEKNSHPFSSEETSSLVRTSDITLYKENIRNMYRELKVEKRRHSESGPYFGAQIGLNTDCCMSNTSEVQLHSLSSSTGTSLDTSQIEKPNSPKYEVSALMGFIEKNQGTAHSFKVKVDSKPHRNSSAWYQRSVSFILCQTDAI